MDNNARDIIYPGSIDHVKFYIMGEHDYVNQSNALVTSVTQYQNNIPVDDGVMSLKLGTTDMGLYCKTCHNDKKSCPTHFGHICLRYPVQIAIENNIIMRWLKIICFKCGNLLINKNVDHISAAKKLREYVKLTRDTNKKCHVCSNVNPNVYYDKIIPVNIWVEYNTAESPIPDKRRLYNHKVVDIFERVTSETVLKMGQPLTSHPRRFLYYIVPCAPVGIRPNSIVNGRKNKDSATTITKSLIAANLKIPTPLPDEISPALSRLLTGVDMIYRALIRGTENTSASNSKFSIVSNTNRPLVGFLDRMPSKTGDIRLRNMGVKTDHICRFVIACGTRTHIREYGISRAVAERMVKPLYIRSDNREWGMMLLMNAKSNTYPMIKTIYRSRTKATMLAQSFAERGYTLEVGDIVYRQLMDGDPMIFNRAPSLKRESFNTHFIKIYDQFVGEMNVSACKGYNADFDGDAMSAVLITSMKAQAETLLLNLIDSSFVSMQNASPSFGFIQDVTIEIAKLTRRTTAFVRADVVRLLRNLPNHVLNTIVIDKPTYTGRDVLSLLMLPINYKGVANFYNIGYAPYMLYDKNDIDVVIKRGQIMSGIIDVKTAGQGVMGSIFHIMCTQFSSTDALDTVYNMQHLGHEYAHVDSNTFHMGDITIARDMEVLVKNTINGILSEVDEITQKVERGELIPPIGKTVEEYYEETLLYGKLQHGDDFREPIMRSISLNNNYWCMIMHGKKGSYLNLQQVMAIIGQQESGGGAFRARRNFGFKRTSSHFTRYDNNPVANGYITESYTKGVGPASFLQAAKAARISITKIALSTSETGHNNRELCCNLQSNITNSLRQTLKNNNMVQALYGENGFDVSKLLSIEFPTVMISDALLNDTYHNNVDKYPNINKSKLQGIFDTEYNAIVCDRNEYRRNYMALDDMSGDAYKFTANAFVPVDVYSVVTDVVYKCEGEKRADVSPIWLIDEVSKFCNNLPYIHTNDIQMAKGAGCSILHIKSCAMLCMLVRTYMCSSNVLRNNLSKDMVDVILSSIFIRAKHALIGYGVCVGLIAGQSFSEPLTQNMLNSHHRSGGEVKTDVLTRAAEITRAKTTDKMNSPGMRLYVLEKYENDIISVQNIATMIEVMTFGKFVKPNYNILFERYGKPTYPKFLSDSTMIDEFHANNPTDPPPNNLIHWCVRFEMDIDAMVSKNIDILSIIYALNIEYPDIYTVYNSVFDNPTIFRCYFKSTLFKKAKYVDDYAIEEVVQNMMNVIIRGVENIKSTRVRSKTKPHIDDDGSIKNKTIHYIETVGTNMSRILDLTNYLQVSRCQTDSIREVEEIWGLEAARHKIMTEFINIINGSIAPQHLRMFSDEMCATGCVVSLIGEAGMDKREKSNWLLRIVYSAAKRVMASAAYNGAVCPVYGVSGPLLMGQTPRIGPNYYRYVVDTNFTTKNVMGIDDIINSL